MPSSEPAPPIVLYDGVCGFCDRAVRLALKFDRSGRLRFAPLQGPTGALVLHRHVMSRPDPLRSMVFVENPGAPGERLHLKSEATVRIWREMGGIWPLAGMLLKAVPRPVRDAAYDWVARRRYGWFGRYDECPVPPVEWRSRFLP